MRYPSVPQCPGTHPSLERTHSHTHTHTHVPAIHTAPPPQYAHTYLHAHLHAQVAEIKKMEGRLQQYTQLGLPTQLIHGDLHYDNVLTLEDSVSGG